MLTESHIDEMTVKWLSQTPNPPRIPEWKAYEDFYKNHLPIPSKFLRQMLCLILKKNSFQFNRRHYLQTHGTATVTKMTVAFANIFMAKIEKGIISKSKIKSLVWKRYVGHKRRQYQGICYKGKPLPRYNKIYGWNIRLRNCILGHKSVQRREIKQRLHPRCAKALQTNRDLSIHEIFIRVIHQV